MGLFDRVWFDCPSCGAPLEAQTKAGDCVLAEYRADDVPVLLAADLEGQTLGCEACLRPYVMRAELPRTCRMRLVSPPESEEES